ncbi:hypothetical protein HHK36_019854 [Tetracentron sinense]|uniref:Transcription termination factor MTEF18, mitochondrial-like n=1 Tax=Tetracentron sinense TaxID=13715 RepID=A0A835DD51_TETSI|nr:hypothetical protein HHK36_019854 [Tetracentron sinense]
MTHLQKFRTPSILKWVSSEISEKYLKSSKPPFFCTTGSLYTAKKSTLYSTRALQTEKCQILDESSTPDCETVARISRRSRALAQNALLEYLHATRCLQFTDAEYMSKNSPNFLEKLLKKVENEQEIGRSLARFFRYHPINEFEPFFESFGLKPSEFSHFLPRGLMFLSDDEVLLENYHVLCNYGIARGKIGKIYKEAMEVFRYDYGVLDSKLWAYEALRLSRSTVIKAVASSPSLLVGDANGDFVKVLEELKSLGMEYNWIEGRLSERNSYNWGRMLGLLCFFSEMGYSKEQLGGLIRSNPGLLFEASGNRTFSLIGLLLKFGSTVDEILPLFLQFPRVQVGTFVRNLRQGLLFLIEVEMEAEEIGRIMRAHPLMLGLCSLKKPNSVLAKLNIGKKRLCGIIKEDPQELKNWILGTKVDPLPNSGEDERSLIQKTEFLLKLGFIENSDEMNKALKVFRGKGGDLQERFDCFVKAGLDRKDVSEMIKVAPQVLNQTRDVIEMKIDFLVNGLGYPISSLVAFPSYLSYKIQRVKLRFSMYTWLKDEGIAAPMLALSTILACSDKIFIKQYVNHHPKGPEVWEKFVKDLS